jgi:hypothetical protein
MSFKQNLESWLDELKTDFSYSHIEKAFTHLYIREFREDHDMNGNDIRTRVVDNSYDLGIDALYVNFSGELILIQSKYSCNDSLLQPEVDKADNFLSKFYELKGNQDDLLLEANKALKKILKEEVFTQTVKTVKFIYLCGSFSEAIRSSLQNLEAKFQDAGKEFYIELLDIETLETLYDPYQVLNDCDIKVIGDQQYNLPEQEIVLTDFPNDKIKCKGRVFTAQADSLKKLYTQFGDSLFEANVRNFLSFLRPINRAIKIEVEKANKSNLWFYNNGLVAICEGYSEEIGIIKAHNLQVVNGGQTVRTISSVNYVAPSLGVNVKLISIENGKDLPTEVRKAFMNELAVNSNKQNPINTRDLKSNDEIQRELQKRFREFEWFLEIKSGEERIDSWKSKLKRNGKHIRNTTLVGSYISFYLQKTNASAGRTALAFLDEDEGDEVINYKNIFGNRANYNSTFKKHLLALYLSREIDTYRKSDIASQFPFHSFSLNIMLALVGFWIYLNENSEKRNVEYVETDVRDFFNTGAFIPDFYLTIDLVTKEICLNEQIPIQVLLNFYTRHIHLILTGKNITTQFRKISNLFKADDTIKSFADTIRPLMGLETSFFTK